MLQAYILIAAMAIVIAVAGMERYTKPHKTG